MSQTVTTTVTEIEYDKSGRVVKETKTVTQNHPIPTTNPHVWTYPNTGRTYTATYLNGSELEQGR